MHREAFAPATGKTARQPRGLPRVEAAQRAPALGQRVPQSFSLPITAPVAGSIFNSTSLPAGSSASAFQMPSS